MFTYKAMVVSVYDGDTFRADVDLGFRATLHAIVFRLAGLNTPEIGQPGSLEARDEVRRLMLGKEVIIESLMDRTEKYGRWLAHVLIPDVPGHDGLLDLNTYLIDMKFAVPYMVGR